MSNMEKDEITAEIGKEIPDDETINLVSNKDYINYLFEIMGVTK